MTTATRSIAAALGLALGLSAGAALACTTDKRAFDLSDDAARELYECVREDLARRYAKSGLAWAEDYRSWTVNSTTPFISATHDNRFVIHYSNDVATDTYMQYRADGVRMPVGSVLGKESFSVNREGEVRPGPLFFMEKVERSEHDGWRYVTVLPSGEVGGPDAHFCHDCHAMELERRDAMFYPKRGYRAAAE